MFSGKTQALLNILREAQSAGSCVALVKPAIDSRNPGEVVSHSGERHRASEIGSVAELSLAAKDAAVVAVDEVQFLDREVIGFLRQLASVGLAVTVAGLDLDFRERPFPSVQALRELADSVRVLTATCTRCGAEATRTQRFVHGEPAAITDPVVLIGGIETYQPRCKRCYDLERVSVER
jgi:thymidine kinase